MLAADLQLTSASCGTAGGRLLRPTTTRSQPLYTSSPTIGPDVALSGDDIRVRRDFRRSSVFRLSVSGFPLVLVGTNQATIVFMVEAHQEAQSRLTSLLSVCECELASLEAMSDSRLALIVQRTHAFRLDLIAALEGLEQPERV